MYDKNPPSASRRAGDDFLRRMLNGELNEKAPRPQSRPSASRDAHASCGCDERDGRRQSTEPDCPSCPYPLSPSMPSLAMVYSPDQAWRCLYSPSAALHAGTLFQELDKPFEGRSVYHRSR